LKGLAGGGIAAPVVAASLAEAKVSPPFTVADPLNIPSIDSTAVHSGVHDRVLWAYYDTVRQLSGSRVRSVYRPFLTRVGEVDFVTCAVKTQADTNFYEIGGFDYPGGMVIQRFGFIFDSPHTELFRKFGHWRFSIMQKIFAAGRILPDEDGVAFYDVGLPYVPPRVFFSFEIFTEDQETVLQEDLNFIVTMAGWRDRPVA
jgi:hypothetical protein